MTSRKTRKTFKIGSRSCARSSLAARRPRVGAAVLGGLVLAGSAVLAWALLSSSPWAVAAVGVTYAAMQATMVLGDARLQARIPDATRATVTSVQALFAAVVSACVFGFVGLVGDDVDPSHALLGVAAVLVLVAVLTARWIRPAAASNGPSGA